MNQLTDEPINRWTK